MLTRIFTDSVFYGGLSGFSKVAIFIVLPFVTRSMDPTMYGRVEILLVFGILISVISISGTDSAFSYYFFKNTDQGSLYSANSVLISNIIWRLSASSAIICVLLIVNNYILDFLSLKTDYQSALYILYANIFFQHLTSVGMDYNRFNFNKLYFSLIVVLQSLSAAVLIIFSWYNMN